MSKKYVIGDGSNACVLVRKFISTCHCKFGAIVVAQLRFGNARFLSNSSWLMDFDILGIMTSSLCCTASSRSGSKKESKDFWENIKIASMFGPIIVEKA